MAASSQEPMNTEFGVVLQQGPHSLSTALLEAQEEGSQVAVTAHLRSRDNSKDYVVSSTDVTSRSMNLENMLEVSSGSLFDSLDSWTRFMLAFCGMNWVELDLKCTMMNILKSAWSTFFMLVVIVAYLGAVVGYSEIASSRSGDTKTISVLFVIGIFTQFVGIAISTYYNILRTWGKYINVELKMFRGSLMATVLLIVAFFATQIYTFFYFSRYASFAVALLFFGVLILDMLLAVNALFIIVDLKVLRFMLKELVEICKGPESLNYAAANAVESEFRKRVKSGYLSVTALMSTALVNVVIVFCLFIVSSSDYELLLLEVFTGFVREVVLSVVVLWHASYVNEEYDYLIKCLGKELKGLMLQPHGEQMIRTSSILLSLHSNPLTISIAGMTVRRKDVLFRFSLWLIGILLALAKEKIGWRY
jgi:hypothetical protein